jgi:hypothetical protein
MTSPTKPNSLAHPVTLQMPQPTQPKSLAISRRDSAALALLGGMLLALAVIMGVSLSGAASGVVRTALGVFGLDAEFSTEQRRHAEAIAGIEQRVDDVMAEVGGLASRANVARYHDAAVSDRFATIETDIAALAVEIRALRAPRNEASAGAPRARVDFLEATVVEVGSSVASLRSSLDEFAEAYRKDIAALAQTHRKDIANLAQTHRKDIADVVKRLDRVEQAVAAREVTSSIRIPVRKRARKHRPAPVVRGTSDTTLFQPVPHPQFPGPIDSSQ